jgi:PmbA protein
VSGDRDPAELVELARGVLARARPGDQVEVVVHSSSSTTVRVHDGEVESFTAADSAAAGVRVVRDGRVGFAHCGSLEPEVLLATLEEAADNCAFAEPDDANGLVVPDGVPVRERDAWSEAVRSFAVEDKIDLALALERAVVAADPRIRGARTTTWSDGWGASAIVSSEGIVGSDRGASCSVGTQPIAVEDGDTQIGFAHDAGRDPATLDLERVAAEAAERATRLLGAARPPSARMAIVLEPRLTLSLLGIVAGMLAGDVVVRGRSPFADRRGERIASPVLSLVDDPTRPESLGSEEIDGEGLACRPNVLVDDGRLVDFLRDGATGRRTGEGSTASAVRGARSLPGVGAQVLVMTPGTRTLAELVGEVEHGVLVNSFSGLHSGVNPVSGDFSAGADGLMIRGGELAEPVKGLTVASSIQRMLLDLRAVGGELEWLTSGHAMCPVVVDDVSVSGD